jgi:hypothetical protein
MDMKWRAETLIVFILLTSSQLLSQSLLLKFHKLSRPEKFWVIAHPCKAKKAFEITARVLADIDSLKKTGIIGSDLNGGQLDAFKHSYWMAMLSTKIGVKKSLKLGKAHEKGNYLEFIKGRLEDSILPDSVSSAMDLHNNNQGIITIGVCAKPIIKRDVQQEIIKAIREGKMMIIKKDKQGNYLYCDGTFIDTNVWAGKWNIPKCMVSSDKD